MGNPLGLKGLKLKRFLLALLGKTLLVTVKEITTEAKAALSASEKRQI